MILTFPGLKFWLQLEGWDEAADQEPMAQVVRLRGNGRVGMWFVSAVEGGREKWCTVLQCFRLRFVTV